MPLTATLGTIRQLPADEAVHYLEIALTEPYEEIQTAAFDLLQEYNRPDIIVRGFPALLPPVRRKIVENKSHFIGVAKDQIRGGVEKTRRAAYDLLAAIGEVDVAGILAGAVNDASTVIRDHAADALEKIALRYHYHLLNWHTKGDERSRLYVEQNRGLMVQALETLLRTFQIHRKAIFIDIAIELGQPTYRIVTDLILSKQDAPLYRGFIQCMEASHSDAAMDILFKLYFEREEHLRAAALEVMRARQDGAFSIALGSWLARLPADKFLQIATRVREAPWWKAMDQNPDLDPALAVKLLEFVAKSFIDPKVRDSMIASLLRSRHAEVRARVIALLRELRSSLALEVARKGISDPSDEVKTVSAKIVVDLNPPDKAKILAPLVSSACAEARTIAVKEVANESYERYMKSFDRLDDRTRSLAAKALAKIDASMMEKLTDEINSLAPERKLKALKIIEYVDAEQDLRPVLMELLNDKDTRVRATAIKIVELSGNIEGMKLLIGALNDPDRRVRANAIEAFEAIGDERFASLLIPFVKDPDNRVRANAAKALWNLGRKDVRPVIEEMLGEGDENMRLSAVWTLGELRYEGAAEVLSERLRLETSEKVKAKIIDTLARLTRPPEAEA